MSDTDLTLAFDPISREKKSEPLPADLVPVMAQRAIDKGDRDNHTLRLILEAAIAHKMTSIQDIGEALGSKAVEVAKGKNPDPATHREVMRHLATLAA